MSPRVTASSPTLLVQGDAVNATVGTEDVELPGLGQQLHVPHLVGAPVHGLGRKAEGNVTFLWHPGGAAGRGLLGAGASGREPRCPLCQVGQGPARPHPCRVKEEAARWAMLPPRQPQRNGKLKRLFPARAGYRQFPGINLSLGSTVAHGPPGLSCVRGSRPQRGAAGGREKGCRSRGSPSLTFPKGKGK